MTLRLSLHGHAYQPPRANPRTGRVPVETGAAPYRDWNERITAECYAPCTATRLHDEQGRVVGIVNLFERMSFDLGPTLAHWLEEHETFTDAPEIGMLGKVFQQDAFNMPKVHTGLVASAKATSTLSVYQESKVRWLHTLLGEWVGE